MHSAPAGRGPMGRGPHGGMAQGEKYKFSATWGKLITYCKAYWLPILAAMIAAVGGTVFTILGPDRISDLTDIITDGMLGSIDLDAVTAIAMVLVVYYASSSLLQYVQGFIMATVTQRITKGMRTDISYKINRLPLKYFDTTSYGDILSRVTNDIDTLGQTLNQSIGNLVAAVALLLGSTLMMFITDWRLAFTAIGASLIGFVLMSGILMRSQKYFAKQQQLLGQINGHVEEVYAGHNVVKVYNAEKPLGKTFDSLNKKLFGCAWKSQFMSGIMMPLMRFVGNLGYVAVCVIGAVMALNGDITFGVIVAFMIYIRLFTQPLSQIAQSFTSLQATAAASYRFFEFLDEEEMPNEQAKHVSIGHVKGDIEFRHVHFGYSADKTIIHDFSASVKAGQKIAIVGPTGAGKTTMVNLLMRFYDVDSGEILVDGVPLNSMPREKVRELFCMVLQDTWLFEGTIRDNIAYNKPGVTDEEIIKVCKSIGAHHFISTLSKGYDTVLNEEANISAGQRQLITIARAVIKNAPMLILDEATSSVDTRTEQLLQDAMDQLMVGRTSIIIAHRLSTIRNADLILVMNEGDIIESGTHDELLKQNGFYADLYNSQFEKVS
ncbi:MAG TPA: ABC transporter ATP-binding protein [Candidatus Limiplasma sp.]|nr:ABC transporter ATP-binding protein [Candidatus Limiplasma sp.]